MEPARDVESFDAENEDSQHSEASDVSEHGSDAEDSAPTGGEEPEDEDGDQSPVVTPKRLDFSPAHPAQEPEVVEIEDTPLKVEQHSPSPDPHDHASEPGVPLEQEEGSENDSVEKASKELDECSLDSSTDQKWRQNRINELQQQLAEAKKKMTSMILAFYLRMFCF